MTLEHEELTGKIIAAAIEVHRRLGPGFILKAIKDLDDIHFAIVRSYLKAMNKEHGLLLNFAKTKLETKRVINRDINNQSINLSRKAGEVGI